MATSSFKCLIFFALVVYAVTADEAKPTENVEKVKRHAYIAAAAPGPVLAYSPPAPVSYSYSYPAYPVASYPAIKNYAAYPTGYPAYPAGYPAYSAGYAAYPYAAYPKYANDDGSYWPGKYEKTYYTAYKTGYPIAYNY